MINEAPVGGRNNLNYLVPGILTIELQPPLELMDVQEGTVSWRCFMGLQIRNCKIKKKKKLSDRFGFN